MSAIGRRRATAKNATNASYHERRAEIVSAAAKVFKAKGFRGTTLADIARAVDADRATLYYYIGSKEELLDEVVTEVVRANVTRVEEIRDSDGAAPEKLHQLVTEMMESYATHYPFLYVYLQENLAHMGRSHEKWSRNMRALNRRWEGAIESILVQGIHEGSIREVADTRIMAYGIIGMFSWTSRWFNPAKSEVDAAAIGEAYASIIMSGLVTDAGTD